MRYHISFSGLRLRSDNIKITSLKLTPEPKYVEIGRGTIEFGSDITVQSNIDPEWDYIIDDFFREINEVFSFETRLNKIPDNGTTLEEIEGLIGDMAIFTEKARKNFEREGYIIKVDKNTCSAECWANTPNGLYYSLQTLLQLGKNFVAPEKFILPHCVILDFPDMELRGVSDDISRGQMPTISNLKHFIKSLSRFKINAYFLYIEDTFSFKSHPDIGEGFTRLSPETVAELDSYAKKYFIELIPIFESLGHMDNILTLKPYIKYAEFPGSDCLNVSNPEIYGFLDDLYGDIAPTFSTEHFHIGCDESEELGAFNSYSYVKKRGKDKVYLEHYLKLYELAKKYGKKKIYMYHDIAAGYDYILNNLPKDIRFVYWNYSPAEKKSHKKLDRIIEKGFEAIISPGCQDWRNLFPDLNTMESNTINLIKYGFDKGAIGVIQSSWGDFRNENLRQNRMYGFAMAGALSWNVENFDKMRFWDAFFLHFFGDDIRISPVLKSIFEFFRKFFIRMKERDYFTLLWAHPFASRITEFDTKGFFELIHEIEEHIKSLENLKTADGEKNIYLKVIHFNLRMYSFLMKKLIIANIGNSIDRNVIKDMDPQQRYYFFNQLKELSSEILELKGIYEKLWLSSCTSDHLDKLLLSFERMHQFFIEKLVQTQNNNFDYNPNIPSQWVFHIKKRKRGVAQHSFFKKVVFIPDGMEHVYIQVIGDTHVRIYVNGEMIDEFFTKYTLSIRMLDNLVKIIDISPYCKPGPNTLVVENINYRAGYGIVNVYGEIYIEHSKDPLYIYTDKSWAATHEFDPEWIKSINPHPLDRTPKSLGAPPLINGSLTYPDFRNGIPSHHTNILGFTNCVILIYIPRYLTWLLKYLSKIALKRGLLI